MTDKEKIRAEIERRRNIVNNAALQMKGVNLYYHYSKIVEEYDDIIRFIDSLQEEPVSEDLDKEMDNYLASVFNEKMDGGEPRFTTWFKALQKTAVHFANWQKEQMMKKEL